MKSYNFLYSNIIYESIIKNKCLLVLRRIFPCLKTSIRKSLKKINIIYKAFGQIKLPCGEIQNSAEVLILYARFTQAFTYIDKSICMYVY